MLNIYSDAQKILDANEMNLFVDNVLASYENAVKKLDESEKIIAEKDTEIARLKALLKKSDNSK